MPPVMSAADFDVLYHRLQRTVAWGPADWRGALNHITPTEIVAAAAEVRLHVLVDDGDDFREIFGAFHGRFPRGPHRQAK